MKVYVSRLSVGFGLVVAAVFWRCLATVTGAPVLELGPHLPTVMRIDFLTGPLALVGVAVLGAVPGLGAARRLVGTLLLVAAIGWPALKLGDMGPVLLTVSSRHGLHTHDFASVPAAFGAMALLTPWRTPLRVPAIRVRPSTPVPAVALRMGAELR